MTAIYLALPFPPSVNDSVDFGRNKQTGKVTAFESKSKRAFIKEADGMFMTQKRALMGQRIDGPFTYHLTLNELLRHPNSDGDNRQKYAIDFLQRVGLITNDKYAMGGSWAWGPCEYPALIGVWPFDPDHQEPVIRRVHETASESAHDRSGQPVERTT